MPPSSKARSHLLWFAEHTTAKLTGMRYHSVTAGMRHQRELYKPIHHVQVVTCHKCRTWDRPRNSVNAIASLVESLATATLARCSHVAA